MRIKPRPSVPLPTQARPPGNIKGLVARVLLEQAGDNAAGRPGLTQRDMAARVGASWEMVHTSLRSLQNEGAIRIERHRLIINKGLLQKMAAG